jgi:ribonucleoside-triphosphate reductase
LRYARYQADVPERRRNEMTEEKMGKGVFFQRIRRITGYLTGDLKTWNDAKKAEEKDRVKHSIKKEI